MSALGWGMGALAIVSAFAGLVWWRLCYLTHVWRLLP